MTEPDSGIPGLNFAESGHRDSRPLCGELLAQAQEDTPALEMITDDLRVVLVINPNGLIVTKAFVCITPGIEAISFG